MTNRLKSYFGSKKRRLSDESNDGDKQKKAKEDNLDLPLNQCDSEGIDSARCASILYECLKSLEKNVNERQLLSTTANDAQIKSTQQLKKVNDAIKLINEKFEELEADRREKEQEMPELKSTLNEH